MGEGRDFIQMPPEGAFPSAEAFAGSNQQNPTTWEHYKKNRLRVVRQLHYSLYNQLCIDFVLFLNGLPLATIELKTDTTQNIEDAVRQYKYDRNPVDVATKQPEPLLSFGKRALVHFAVSTDEVQMATKLAGAATRFLPFNRGNPDGMGGAGAGNPPDDALGYSTGYLWHEVFQRDAWLAVVGKFLSVEVSEAKDAKGKKVFNTSLLFPRYHQWDAVNKLLNATLAEGVGHTYLVQHSAGSGKSNTIGWLAHRLASRRKPRRYKTCSVAMSRHSSVLTTSCRNCAPTTMPTWNACMRSAACCCPACRARPGATRRWMNLCGWLATRWSTSKSTSWTWRRAPPSR